MKTLFKVVLAFLLFMVVSVGVMFVYMTRGMDELQEAQVRASLHCPSRTVYTEGRSIQDGGPIPWKSP
jgi:hypothetical protein